jgi:hypothetical protein
MENSDKTKTISVLVNGKWTCLVVEKILYCKADGDYTLIFMFNILYPRNQKPPLRASGYLLEIEKLIASGRFVRMGRTHLVNADYYIHAKSRGRKAFVLLQNEVRIDIPYRIFDDVKKKFEEK